MADWTDSLRFASFRGVPFEVESVSFSGGRRVAVYEMPGRDQAVTEDLGRKPRIAPFAAYVIGARATRKAILLGCLDPVERLQQAEAERRMGEKLGLMEECRTLPFGAVWDKLCLDAGVPVGGAWMGEVARYEKDVLATRT